MRCHHGSVPGGALAACGIGGEGICFAEHVLGFTAIFTGGWVLISVSSFHPFFLQSN